MTINLRQHVLTAQTGSFAWTFSEGDNFKIPVISLKFDIAPTSAGSITVTVDSVNGASYDVVRRAANPVGSTSVVFENINGLFNGDKVLVEYSNPDSRSVTGVATVEI